MFKIYNLSYLLIAAAALVGCKKKLLEKDPLALNVEQNFYKTDQDIILAINAAYDPLGWETDRGGAVYALPFFFGDVCSDDALKGGSGESDLVNFHNLETFTGNSGYPELDLPWDRYYTGIYRANLVIEKVQLPECEASQALKDRVTGEAKFLRALYHFELIKMYGDVPLITKVLSPEEYKLSRTPKADVFAQIEADFTDAADVLPEKGGIETGRATRGAALAFLARAQMYQTLTNPGKWGSVLQNAEAVIANSPSIYDLEPNYADIHTVAHENGIESIFEIQHITNAAGQGGSNGSNWATGNEGTFINVMQRGRQNGGWGFNIPTQSLLDEFEAELTVSSTADPRLAATIIQDGDVVHGETYVADAGSYPFTGMYCRKYIEPTTVFGLNQSDGPSNYILMRYADVLLMAAEAANELGQTAKALGYLKEVRDRVQMPEITETDKDLLREIIWRERRVELALEGHRFFDLVRQGRAAQVMQATPEGTAFVAGKHEVFPIHQSEIDLSGMNPYPY